MTSLSFWEKKEVEAPVDLLIIGSGLVGLCSAIAYCELHPTSRIRVIDRGIFPHGASTKNAGFACLGSPTELLADLAQRPRNEVLDTLAMRHEGLQRLFSLVPKANIAFEACGGFELFRTQDHRIHKLVLEQLDDLNDLYFEATGERNAIQLRSNYPHFPGISGAATLRLEGALNPWLLVTELQKKARSLGIEIWNGIEVTNVEESSNEVIAQTNIGALHADRVLLCTNGLTKSLIKSIDLEPARAQVLVARSDHPLEWKGTFHLDEGYYYFRHLDEHRVLLGGGRNLDFEGEQTSNIDVTELIQNSLEDLLKVFILPESSFEIEHRWAGIMAIGNGKKPLIDRASGRVGYAVRMGGMGVAIGAEVAHRAARLWE